MRGGSSTFYAGQGAVVRKGQKLADLESADIDEAEADYLKALADLENANRTSAAEIKFNQATYDRTKLLVEKEITPAKNLQQAEHDLDLAKANAANAISSCKGRRLKRSPSFAHPRPERCGGQRARDQDQNLGIVAYFRSSRRSPASSSNATASVGATVGTDANVFKIVDLSSVWIDANVFEKDLDRVRRRRGGQGHGPALSRIRALSGRVILISSVVDPETRTVKVRTEVRIRRRLKPDMFANVEIVTAVHSTAISVPLAAVLDDGGKSVVFVADGTSYDKREVTLGLKSDDRVEIVTGPRTPATRSSSRAITA